MAIVACFSFVFVYSSLKKSSSSVELLNFRTLVVPMGNPAELAAGVPPGNPTDAGTVCRGIEWNSWGSTQKVMWHFFLATLAEASQWSCACQAAYLGGDVELMGVDDVQAILVSVTVLGKRKGVAERDCHSVR